jgi:hypothetical protein
MNIKIRIKSVLSHPRTLASMLLGVLILLSSSGPPVLAQTVLQGYSSDEVLQRGMLVVLKEGDQTKVEAATAKTIEKLKGVVADAKDSPVTISGGEGQKIFVATSGSYEVLVSNENGPINAGDYVSISSLAGIGMKTNETIPTVVGRAVNKFEGGGDSIGKSQGKDGRTVSFGRIKVDMEIGRNPTMKDPEKDKVPDALQRVADTVAQKPVSTLRIYLALAVLVITALVAAVTLFAGVRSTIISLGRNPLSKGIIYKGLFQVLLVSLIIFITGLFGVYLLIKL